MNSHLSTFFASLVGTIIAIIVFSAAAYAGWLPFPSTPPQNNVTAPIHTGNVGQLKTGGLEVNRKTPSAPVGLMLLKSGSAQNGRLVIAGSTAPSNPSELDITGNIGITRVVGPEGPDPSNPGKTMLIPGNPGDILLNNKGANPEWKPWDSWVTIQRLDANVNGTCEILYPSCGSLGIGWVQYAETGTAEPCAIPTAPASYFQWQFGKQSRVCYKN